MKRRDFMKLSAATALGATVAAMAPSALAATELDQTNGDLHTTVDRKTAAMGLGDGKTFAYDPVRMLVLLPITCPTAWIPGRRQLSC